MSFWTDKYVGKKWFFDVPGYDGDKMCILFILHVLRELKGFDIQVDDKDSIKDLPADWYEKAPTEFIDRAIKYGKVIENVSDLKEFDIVFFRMNEKVRHCGLVTATKGMFIHQMNSCPAYIDRLSNPKWLKRFYIGLRCV